VFESAEVRQLQMLIAYTIFSVSSVVSFAMHKKKGEHNES